MSEYFTVHSKTVASLQVANMSRVVQIMKCYCSNICKPVLQSSRTGPGHDSLHI